MVRPTKQAVVAAGTGELIGYMTLTFLATNSRGSQPRALA